MAAVPAPAIAVGALAELLRAACEEFAVPGAQLGLQVGDDRVVVCHGAVGGPGSGPVVPATKFHAGSIAKSLAALTICDAAARGELDLDVSCAAQAPGLWSDTPRTLLQQTSGRPNVLPDVGEDLEDFVSRVGAMPRLHEPGAFSYCNSGWSVLDLLLRKRTGSTFEARAAELLGGGLTFGAPADGAQGHGVGPDLTPRPTPPDYAEAGSAAGARWWASADELLDYARLHLEGSRTGVGSIAAADVLDMQRQHVAIPGATVADGWGLGWAVWDRVDHRAFGWSGYTGGHRAYLRCFPAQDAAFVVLANAAGPLLGPPGGSAVFDRLLPELLEPLGVPPLPDAPLVGAAAPSDVAGGYGPVTVEASPSGGLVVHAEALGEAAPIAYRHVGGTTFAPDPPRPGGMAIAFADGLLYLGPMALARTSTA